MEYPIRISRIFNRYLRSLRVSSGSKYKIIQLYIICSHDGVCYPPPTIAFPHKWKAILSPISITEFISWVLITVVMSYSCVISLIRLSIRLDVFGSRPEFGSSQKRYLGFKAIALAIATLFFIPPLISDGYSLFAFRILTPRQAEVSPLSLLLMGLIRKHRKRKYNILFNRHRIKQCSTLKKHPQLLPDMLRLIHRHSSKSYGPSK